MAIVDKPTLKTYFNAGDVPTESNYIDLIDSLGGIPEEATLVTGDWNDVITTGFYRGNNLTNSPVSSWVYMLVIRDSDNNVLQEAVYYYTAGTPLKWIRRKISGSWESWKNIWPAAWGDLSGKPSTFTPSAHTHPGTDITSAVANATNATNAGYATSAGNADTVDSLHAESFVRSDSNDNKTGYLTLSNNGLTLGSTTSYASQGQIALVAGNIISRPASVSYDVYAFRPLINYVGSATYSGGAFSTFGKTPKTISTEFSGVPAQAKALLLNISIRDSASAANECWFMSSPNASAGDGITVRCSGLANDKWSSHAVLVPTNGSGTIYFQAQASGTSTLDVSIRCWGYCV
jgi:hypothetical protein